MRDRLSFFILTGARYGKLNRAVIMPRKPLTPSPPPVWVRINQSSNHRHYGTIKGTFSLFILLTSMLDSIFTTYQEERADLLARHLLLVNGGSSTLELLHLFLQPQNFS